METTMASDHAARLEGQVKEFRKQLGDLAAPGEFEEFLRIIHRPGWTTPAEYAFVSAILDGMVANVRGLAQMKTGPAQRQQGSQGGCLNASPEPARAPTAVDRRRGVAAAIGACACWLAAR
jgi:hypothetical protein